ncbi:D-2-hydroxyacid dehydrogenase [Tenuibacillus multivorans]|uniref:Phosphoglycerate dehydrogenase n=1 Tax=Tenuibacillus multivorans TaxID=237069 RepID=A0A1H0FXN3_9BACI|nr:D-2-hydroxyacid dehydrogenase [Tenuibacillus multivorans]GEL78168.1 2-hydroxyacid dehydrogenase [Tenuibacillus multivorans]SDN99370.1 Phosphoglycerate dehydrogenase [Tenuibacillus multivorans]
MNVLVTLKMKEELRHQLKEKYPSLTFQFKYPITEAEPYMPKADIIITYGEDLTNEHINQAENLKWIMVMSAGLDQMPFEKIIEKNILVTNARGIHTIQMSEYVIAMLLQVYRNLPTSKEYQKQHVWNRKVKIEEITGKTMLILGTGAIGQETARLAKAFNMETIGVSRTGELKAYFDTCYKNEELMDLLPKADFVINVLPATPDTEKMITKEHFIKMKGDAVFLNMGRGITVVEEDMIDALKNHQIRHAILDVFEQEPLDENSPLWDLENVTITPHNSSITSNYMPRALNIFEQNLDQFLKGEKPELNVIDPKRGY